MPQFRFLPLEFNVMVTSSVLFVLADMVLGICILINLWSNRISGRGLFPLIDEVRRQYRGNKSGRHFRIASAAAACASFGQVLLGFSYLLFLAAGGQGFLPFQFPNIVEFAVVSVATIARELIGAFSRYHYVKGLKRVYKWMLKEEPEL